VEKRTKQGNFRTCIKEGCDWEIEAPAAPEAGASPEGGGSATPPVGSVSAKPEFVHPQEPATVGSSSKS
ncbi:MAG: hypothetical protein WBY73_00080, partial [Candidatus Acidiferrales bacterium]